MRAYGLTGRQDGGPVSIVNPIQTEGGRLYPRRQVLAPLVDRVPANPQLDRQIEAAKVARDQLRAWAAHQWARFSGRSA